MIFIPKIKRDTNLYKRKGGNYAFRVVEDGRSKFITLHTKTEKAARDMRTAMVRDMIARGVAVFDSDLATQTGAQISRSYVLRLPGIPVEYYETLPDIKRRLRGLIASQAPAKKR